MRFSILIVVFMLSVSATGQSLDSLSDAQWVNDLDELTQVIKARHANPYHMISRQYLNDRIDNLSYRIPELSTAEKLVEFIKIVSLIGDGHTVIKSMEYFKLYPIIPYWFGNELRATWIANEFESVVGWQITAIDGKPISEVKNAVDELSPKGENDNLLLQWSQSWLRNADVLHVLGVTESPISATYSMLHDDGRTQDITLSALAQEDYGTVKWICAYDPIPNFMNRQSEPIWFEKANEYTLYVNFNHYPDQKVMKELTNQILVRLEDHLITHLVIDFRDNATGDPEQGEYLIKKLQKSEFTDHGVIYVITGRKTFSAAMMNAIHFRDVLRAKIVGEAPSQRPNGFTDAYTFTLTHSQLKASCSSEFYQLTDSDTDEVVLDEVILPNFQSLKAGRDEVLEWIMVQH